MMQIFISYSRADTAFARQLAEDLSDYDLKIWMDVVSIPKGANWDIEVQKGLDDSTMMLVLLSPSSVASQNVADEWSYFIEKGKPIFPLMIAPCDVPFRLSRRQRVNFMGDYKVGFEELIRALGSPRLLDPDSTQRITPPAARAPVAPPTSPSAPSERVPTPRKPGAGRRATSEEPEVAARILPVIWSSDYHWFNGMQGGTIGEVLINNREINLVPRDRPRSTIPLSSLISVKELRGSDPYLKITYYGQNGVFQSMVMMGASRTARKAVNDEVMNLLKLMTKRSLE